MSFVAISTQQGVNRFLNALTLPDGRALEYALNESATMRVWRWDGVIALYPRQRIIDYLASEWAAWTEPQLETISVVPGASRGSAEFRIYAYERDRYVEHNRSVFVSFLGEKIQSVDMYCAEPIPSAHRKDWLAPSDLDNEALRRLFDEYEYIIDHRDLLPRDLQVRSSLRGRLRVAADGHPASNGGGQARWTADNADSQIASLIEQHRVRDAAFIWYIGPFDTPPDLAERLIRHGFVFAGDTACMARSDLDALEDIPAGDALIEQVRPDDDETIEQVLQISARCFHMTPEQVDRERPALRERIGNPKYFATELHFIAQVEGIPVGESTLMMGGGVAYLGGASTLPEYRNRHIYSGMLRTRLEVARARGFRAALIHAEPMSRRIVARYRFREVGRYHIYAWMPVLDMDVIRSLVPDE